MSNYNTVLDNCITSERYLITVMQLKHISYNFIENIDVLQMTYTMQMRQLEISNHCLERLFKDSLHCNEKQQLHFSQLAMNMNE